MSVTYRLERHPLAAAPAPVLDADQRTVVDHSGGPLLVLAGPGTGKTTTLVEAVVDRVERRGVDPARILVLTFSRKAAVELRDRISGRLRRTTAAPLSSTFHSFCYALLRSSSPDALYPAPLRLLSSAEQDVRLRDLLASSAALDTVPWPETIRPALGTRGLAAEVQAVLSRARERGLSPEQLGELGGAIERPEWSAVARFMEEYLTVLDFEGALDYAELVHRAVLLAEQPDVQDELRSRFAAVFVDEYQDTDPAQVRLLQAIAGAGRDLVVVGDPDQSIYGFRGADVRGILDFPTAFPRREGTPAPVVALTQTRRFGAELLAVSRRIAAGIGVSGSIDAPTLQRFRNPVAAESDQGAGAADVRTYPSAGAQADGIADLVRRAHLLDGVPWSQIAVLVRSGVLSIPPLRRALIAAGVPVTVAGDELPLASEPAVQPLLAALQAASAPQELSGEAAAGLITSPLGGVDPAGVRRVGRWLRWQARSSGPAAPARSVQLLRDALVEPLLLADADDPAAVAVRRLGELVNRAQAQLRTGASAEEALWTLWAGTSWPRRLRSAVERGGPAARAANRDLDAVCALFQVAARAEERRHHTSVEAFLAELRAEQIPADNRSDAGVRADGVRLLTAHRSKGLEWQLVVVAGVQEGSWPDLRRRGTLLQADRIAAGGGEPATRTSLLADERRLFYVAATRARHRLVVTAVCSAEADGEQPSRFLDCLGIEPVAVPGRPDRPLSLSGLVSTLRRVAGDADASPALRRAAAARLARLGAERVGNRPVAPGAAPETWWGTAGRTQAPVSVRPPVEPLALSGSALRGLLACPLRWFLSREAAGESPRSSAMGFGSVLHVLAEELAARDDDAPDVLEARLDALLDSVWPQLQFESPWIARRERAAARDAVRRLIAWHRSRPERSLVDSEVSFDVTVPVPDSEPVRLRGRIDRLERDPAGALHVIDFKTGRSAPSDSTVPDDPQLGLYQLAVDAGAVSTSTLRESAGTAAASAVPACAGAELVQLRVDAGGFPRVQRQEPQRADETGRRPVESQLAAAVERLRLETFDAVPGRHCTLCEFQPLCPAGARAGSVLS